MKLDELSLYRSGSCSKSTKQILPSNYVQSSPYQLDYNEVSDRPLVQKFRVIQLTQWYKPRNVVEMIRSLVGLFSFSSILPTCNKWLSNPCKMLALSGSGSNVTGTMFGYKKGHVSFAVQEDSRSEPVLLLEFAVPTCMLVQEMSSGLVRIALECEKGSGRGIKLLQEPTWTMYCNGKRCGYAVSRTCLESDWYMLSAVQSVSAGAGVIPIDKNKITTNGMEGDQLMYMRAKFERVVGNRNSEAYYMMNPDGLGGPELSIFLLRM
ncbi:hypothetical protein IFM89_037683 [Coptis chinensis]|uniref:Protein MIZU-KUSSEI 1 n=1 Tax=Coptis chinensis TaxID=261450 RepID=A0A835M3D5_9MAGN|nr:hypothetical protein IFM89_013946 [Coptis chinensis]KAF9617620.1 hypothetical protein IFM89_037683 [Coptis chinensis]